MSGDPREASKEWARASAMLVIQSGEPIPMWSMHRAEAEKIVPGYILDQHHHAHEHRRRQEQEEEISRCASEKQISGSGYQGFARPGWDFSATASSAAKTENVVASGIKHSPTDRTVRFSGLDTSFSGADLAGWMPDQKSQPLQKRELWNTALKPPSKEDALARKFSAEREMAEINLKNTEIFIEILNDVSPKYIKHKIKVSKQDYYEFICYVEKEVASLTMRASRDGKPRLIDRDDSYVRRKVDKVIGKLLGRWRIAFFHLKKFAVILFIIALIVLCTNIAYFYLIEFFVSQEIREFGPR